MPDSVGAFVGKEEPLFTSDGKAKYFSLHGNYWGDSSKASELSYHMTLHPGHISKGLNPRIETHALHGHCHSAHGN